MSIPLTQCFTNRGPGVVGRVLTQYENPTELTVVVLSFTSPLVKVDVKST